MSLIGNNGECLSISDNLFTKECTHKLNVKLLIISSVSYVSKS